LHVPDFRAAVPRVEAHDVHLYASRLPQAGSRKMSISLFFAISRTKAAEKDL
jgi:hypothetical protein